MYTGSVLRNVPEQRFYIFMAVKVDYKGRDREGIPLSFTDSRKNESGTKASFTFAPRSFHTDKTDFSRGRIINVMEKA